MRLSILRAGGHFGKLGYVSPPFAVSSLRISAIALFGVQVRGEYKFSLAPNEQKVWKDYHLVLINVGLY